MCYAESLVRGKPRCTTCISCVAKIFLYNLELYRLSFSFSLSFLLTGVLSIACSHRGCCPSSFSLPLLFSCSLFIISLIIFIFIYYYRLYYIILFIFYSFFFIIFYYNTIICFIGIIIFTSFL